MQGNNFNNVSSDIIQEGILAARDFHLSPWIILKETLWFVDITDKSESAIEFKPDDNSQPITDSKNEKTKKRFKHVVKRKAWRNNLHTPVQAPTTGSTAFLFSYYKSPTPLLSRLGQTSTTSSTALLLFQF